MTKIWEQSYSLYGDKYIHPLDSRQLTICQHEAVCKLSGKGKGNTQMKVQVTEAVSGGQVYYRERIVNRSSEGSCQLSLLWEMTHFLEQKAEGPNEIGSCSL